MTLVYLFGGVALLCAAVLPRLLERLPLSPAMIFVGVGALTAQVPSIPRITFDPSAVEHLTELCVIVALMGVGLALDRPLSWRGWTSTWRLLGVGMPAFIAIAAALAWGMLGVGAGVALLLAASLAPTDPVLASDVQVGEPTDDPRSEDEVRFALTSEAGLNDGLAFPFVHAAILLTAGALSWGWVAWELVGMIAIGVAVGWGVGQVLGQLAFRAPTQALRFADTAEALVALCAVFIAYGAAELLGGYGFISVFCAALAIRNSERGHEYHRVLHEFIGQIERLLTLALLLAFGYALGSGLLAGLSLPTVIWGLLLVFLIRPATSWLAMAGSRVASAERLTIAFFGVRGIGSFYYVSYGLNHADFGPSETVWQVVAFAVLASILIHGATASPVLRRLDSRAGRSSPEPV